MPKVKEYKEIGKHQTYDLEVDHPDHQFYLANGLLTSNSHAISYAVNSYYCAWLLTYYPDEWIASYLDTSSSNPTKLAKAISEVKSMGYRVTRVDINQSSANWRPIGDKKLAPSFTSCKGIGDAAIVEILNNRPYKDIYDLLWNEDGSWKHKKLNKRTLQTLMKLRALESIDWRKDFKSYRHMHDLIIDNWDNLRKRTKKDPYKGQNILKELLVQEDSMITKEWSIQDIAKNTLTLMGTIDLDSLLPEEFHEKLREKNIRNLDDYSKPDVYWFMITDVKKKKTRHGKPYLMPTVMTLSGETHRMFVWGTPENAELMKYSIAAAQVDKSDFGFATRWSKIISLTK